MPLIDIPKDARKGKEPCGECHLKPGETCDMCGARRPAKADVLEAFVKSVVDAKLNLHGIDARNALETIQKQAKLALSRST